MLEDPRQVTALCSIEVDGARATSARARFFRSRSQQQLERLRQRRRGQYRRLRIRRVSPLSRDGLGGSPVHALGRPTSSTLCGSSSEPVSRKAPVRTTSCSIRRAAEKVTPSPGWHIASVRCTTRAIAKSSIQSWSLRTAERSTSSCKTPSTTSSTRKGVVARIDKNSAQLADELRKGTPMIITTLQKFPSVTDEISQLPSRRYELIVART